MRVNEVYNYPDASEVVNLADIGKYYQFTWIPIQRPVGTLDNCWVKCLLGT